MIKMRKSILLLLVLMLFFTVTGCSVDGTSNDNNKQPLNGDTTNPGDNDTLKYDSGTFNGWIDNNSIEIKISGVPNEIGAKAFRLTDKAKDKINELQIKEGDQVKFSYDSSVEGQPLIITIEKI